MSIRNANIFHGDIRSYACPEKLCECVGKLDTLYPLENCECFGFEGCQDIVKGFCKDQYFHIIDGKLKQSTEEQLCAGEEPCMAGAPFPTDPPPTSGSNCSASGCDTVAVSYVTTFVTEHAGVQVESAPSPVSEPVVTNGQEGNTLITLPTPPEGYCVEYIRLYRVESTFEDGTDSINPANSEFLLLAEFPASFAGVPVQDFYTTAQTGGPLLTYSPMAFPAPCDLCSVTRTTDGIAVADKCRVYISIPGQPQFTWGNVVEIEDTIERIVAIGNTIFVFTDGYPVKIGYRHNDGVPIIDKQVIQRKLPLCSCSSLSVFGNDVYFATEYSLYKMSESGGQPENVLSDMISPDQWKNLDPSSIRGTAFEYGYIFSSDSINGSIMVGMPDQMANSTAGKFIMPLTNVCGDAFGTDDKGHIIHRDCNHVYKWDFRECGCEDGFDITDNLIKPLTTRCDCCPFSITVYVDNQGKNRFSKARLDFDERAGPLNVSFQIERFGNEHPIVEDYEVKCSRGFPIPGFCSGRAFSMTITGCSILHQVKFATSYAELANDSNAQIEPS